MLDSLRRVHTPNRNDHPLPFRQAAAGRALPEFQIIYITGGEGTLGARHREYSLGPGSLMRRPPGVTASAPEGDPLALNILHTGAEELALLVQSVVRQSPWIQNRVLVLAGGVMDHDPIVTGRLKELLARDLPDLQVAAPRGTALEGACLLALRGAGR
jgi:hypothetical protein